MMPIFLKYKIAEILFPILIFSASVISFGQIAYSGTDNKNINDCTFEKVYVHLAKNSIAAGEELPFKAYLITNKNGADNLSSSVLYFDIIDEAGLQLASWRSNISGGTASGLAEIPDTIASGVYLLRSYTKWMMNAGNDYIFQTPLLIANLAEENIKALTAITYKPAVIYTSETNEPNSEAVDLHTTDNSPLQIELDKDSYTKGETVKVKISINNLFNSNNLKLSCSISEKNEIVFLSSSISISDYINIFSDYPISAWYNKNTPGLSFDSVQKILAREKPVTPKIAENCSYIKESDAYLLSGRISDKQSGKALSGAKILISVIGNAPFIDYSITNINGEFFFWLNSSLDNGDLILQVYEEKITNSNVKWQIYKEFPLALNLESNVINLSAVEMAQLESLKQLSLVNRIYNPKEPVLKQESGEKLTTISYNPNYSIFPADYEQLENFKEISDNILPGVALKKKRNAWFMQVFDPDTKMILDSGSMVLLNGIPFSDLDYISKLPIGEIDRIDIYQSNIFYGQLNFFGIVAIYTKNPALPAEYIINQTKLLKNPVLERSETIISTKTSTELKNPNLNNLLYWNPNFKIENNGEIILEVPSTDYKGKFEITVEGITNSNIPISARKTFTIE